MDGTKEHILTLALEAFSNRGYNSVGVQEICTQAGLTKPTLYYHFKSKQGLLAAIAETYYDPFVYRVGKAFIYTQNVSGSLNQALDVFLDSARTTPVFTRLRLALTFSPPDSEEHRTFLPYTESLYRFAGDFFMAASKDHGNMIGRELAYAASFIGTADAYAALILAGTLDLGQKYQPRIVHHFMHGIYS